MITILSFDFNHENVIKIELNRFESIEVKICQGMLIGRFWLAKKGLNSFSGLFLKARHFRYHILLRRVKESWKAAMFR